MLQTQKLLLRRPREQDGEELLAIRNSPFVLRCNAMEPMDGDGMAQALRLWSRNEGAFCLEELESGRVVGMVFFGEDSLRYRVPSRELSYYLGQDFSRKGYMSQALRTLIPYAMEHWDLQVITARVFAGNTPSLGLMERLGFVREGCLRRCVQGYGGVVHDDVLLSLLREELDRLPPIR